MPEQVGGSRPPRGLRPMHRMCTRMGTALYSRRCIFTFVRNPPRVAILRRNSCIDFALRSERARKRSLSRVKKKKQNKTKHKIGMHDKLSFPRRLLSHVIHYMHYLKSSCNYLLQPYTLLSNYTFYRSLRKQAWIGY